MIGLLDDLLSHENDAQPFCMAVIVQNRGSTPRSAGSRMLIFNDRTIRGTIGGGKLEAEVITSAMEVIRSENPRILDFEFSGADAASLDMICGGNAKILLEPVSQGSTSLWEALHAIKTANMDQKPSGWLITEIRPDSTVVDRYVAQLEEYAPVEELLRSQGKRLKNADLITSGETQYFLDPMTEQSSVYIFGAGHVSQSLASVTQLVGFRTIVIDDRSEFASRSRFPNCDEVLVIDPVQNMFVQREFHSKDLIVIVTRGHLQDQVVLESALQTSAGYIGMIGSKRKRELIFKALQEKGFGPEQVARVHSPIGINIGAETPEEIAVSIAAELIQQRLVLR